MCRKIQLGENRRCREKKICKTEAQGGRKFSMNIQRDKRYCNPEKRTECCIKSNIQRKKELLEIENVMAKMKTTVE